MEYNPLALRLIAAVLRDYPDWRDHAAPYGPDDDAEADPASVIFTIPAPEDTAHRLEIAQRGNAIEVAYDCGRLGLRAEQQFVFAEEEFDAALADLRGFLRQLHTGDVYIVREPLGRIVRAIRRDGVTELAFFRQGTAGEVLAAGTTVHRWTNARPRI